MDQFTLMLEPEEETAAASLELANLIEETIDDDDSLLPPSSFSSLPPHPSRLSMTWALFVINSSLLAVYFRSSNSLNSSSSEKHEVHHNKTSLSESAASSNTNNNLLEDFSCIWAPEQNKVCLDLIRNRLPPPEPQPRRWLFWGDSTVSRLFSLSNLLIALVQSPLKQMHNQCYAHMACDHIKGGRCKLNDLFGLSYPVKWTSPKLLNFTGPLVFGADNPYCTDCSGCNSNFLKCDLLQNVSADSRCDASRREFTYGGYIAMEFARDIEIQTPEFLTTQENLAAYIHRVWNTPDMIQEWGKPMCVISAGIHDVAINNISTVDYLRNVNSMLKNFTSVCEHIIWLGNTAPSGGESHHLQTIDNMKSWDNAVRELIGMETEFFHNMSFIDVHNASLTWPHDDHIHMKSDWYQQLGNNFFLPLVQME